MTKKITPQNNTANQQNANKGTAGTNRQYDQSQGNRVVIKSSRQTKNRTAQQ